MFEGNSKTEENETETLVKNQIENEKEESLDDVSSIKSQIEEQPKNLDSITKNESHDQMSSQTLEEHNEILEMQAETPEQSQNVPNSTAQHSNDENEKTVPESGEVSENDDKNITKVTDNDMPDTLEKNSSDEKMAKDIDSMIDENCPDLIINEDPKGFQETAEEIIDELYPEEPKMKASVSRIY